MASGMLMGALSGLGKGMVANAQRWTAEDMKAAEQQAELEKEQRIFERQKELKAIDNTYEIDREKRGIENDKTRAQNKIDIETDPANVEKASNAQIGMLRAKDQYKDSRFDTELDQAGRMARATHIDNTDYEGRKLSHEALRLQLEEARKGSKLSDSEKETIKIYKDKVDTLNKDIKEYQVKLADSTLDEGSRKEVQTQLEVAIAARNQAYSNALSIANKGAKSTGPSRDVIDGDVKDLTQDASYHNEKLDKDTNKRAELLKELRSLGGEVAEGNTLSNSDLMKIIEEQKMYGNNTQATSDKLQQPPKNNYASLLEQRKAFSLVDEILSLSKSFNRNDLESKSVAELQAILKEINEAESDRKRTRRASFVGH